MAWFRYRTIRSQLTIGFILLQLVFTACFALMILRTELMEIHARAARRIEQQVKLLDTMSADVMLDAEMDRLQPMLSALSSSTSVSYLRVTDAAGNSLLPSSKPLRGEPLSLVERRVLEGAPQKMVLFQNGAGNREAVEPVRDGDRVLGYAWVAENPAGERQEVRDLIRVTLLATVLGALGCLMASAWLARSITRPLKMVMEATRRLIRDPETKQGFPLDVPETNEAGELAEAFNLLVLSMEEQRSGLNDTLALLDSMLAHAPIGFAFLDRQARFIRVNNFLASGMGIPLTRFLGQTPEELFGREQGETMHARLARIFEGTREEEEGHTDKGVGGRGGYGVGSFEVLVPDDGGTPRSWLVNMYPVKSGQQDVRWVGAVMIDTTERRRSEDALRRTEKLAAAGQLAASIAHEINNPLEAVTNLLFLLKTQSKLDAEAARFADMAQHELARVSEITQQTLRFYRPSTSPAVANVGEIMDSILTLHSGRTHTLRVNVERRYGADVKLFCLSGALRQVFANLLTNALDALNGGGRLVVRAVLSQSWKDGRPGVRVVVADTGSGMADHVRKRIFEPFFTTKLATGTGLGLWVTQDIMEKHHGTIAVRSRCAESADNLGETMPKQTGTVFMLFFPERGVERAKTTAKVVEAATVVG
ncbi:MAG: histidine kinase [Acidobacteriaceae bacterium]|nr:histidine kinase [Acidobacteriaceae bacterium]